MSFARDKLEKYACGHVRRILLFNASIFSITEYLYWKDNFGFDGNNSLCWDCFCKQLKQEENNAGED